MVGMDLLHMGGKIRKFIRCVFPVTTVAVASVIVRGLPTVVDDHSFHTKSFCRTVFSGKSFIGDILMIGVPGGVHGNPGFCRNLHWSVRRYTPAPGQIPDP